MPYIKEPNKPTFFITDCGCKLLIADTIFRKELPRTCKEHGGETVSVERECIDCDIKIKLSNTGFGFSRCETHRKIAKQKSTKRSNQKAKNEGKRYAGVLSEKESRIKRFNIDKRGGYCTGSAVCVIQRKVKCQGCKEFIPAFFGFDPAKLPGFYKEAV